MNKLIINSESSGKYRLENMGGRQYLVTQMMPIQANSVMNDLLYPATAVFESYPQLNNKRAPAGHPTFSGEAISANSVFADAFNVGAFVRNPTPSADNVVADLVVDLEVANQSDKGKQIVNRIKSGKRLSVSTGLNAKVDYTAGKIGDKEYQGIVSNIEFDHVALLLNEPPAGEFTYTLNTSKFFNQDEGVKSMREITVDTTNLSLEDHKFLQNCAGDAGALVKAMKRDFSVNEATEVLTNAGKNIVDADKYNEFLTNSDAFAQFKSEKAAQRQEKIDFIVNNSKMTAEQVSVLDDESIESLTNSIKPKNMHIVNGKVEKEKFELLEGL